MNTDSSNDVVIDFSSLTPDYNIDNIKAFSDIHIIIEKIYMGKMIFDVRPWTG